MSKQQIKNFIHFSVVWVACNLSIPFWVVGHVHLSINSYHDLIEIISSLGMNIVVGVGFWLNWKDESKKIINYETNR
jgi:hypothetical protein